MERNAEGREEWGVEVLPAEVDLSHLSVERACFALGRLRAALAAWQTGTSPAGVSQPPSGARTVMR